MKTSLLAAWWTKLKSIPLVAGFSSFMAGVAASLKIPAAFALLSQKFVAGTLVTKVGISALSVSMIGATGAGGYIAVQQLVGSAGSQYAITSPASGTTVSSDFAINTEFRAMSDISGYINIVVTLDGRTIMSKVGGTGSGPIKNGSKIPYVFSGGVNGVNAFPVDNLAPGPHTITAIARTGGQIGQGTTISSNSVGINARPNNIIVTGEGGRAIPAGDLPINTSVRSLAPDTSLAHQLASSLNRSKSSIATAVSGSANNVQNFVLPKAEAHTGDGKRHGDIDVFAELDDGTRISGVPVTVNHPALDGCHSGNSGTTNSLGAVNFRGCGVTNNYQTPDDNKATYTITVGDTPNGYTIDGPKTRTMVVEWNQNKNIRFIYKRSAAPGGGTAPASNPIGQTLNVNNALGPNQSLKSGGGCFTLIMQGNGHLVLYEGKEAIWDRSGGDHGSKLVLQADGNLVLYTSSNGVVWATYTSGSGGDKLIMQDDGNLVLYNSNWHAAWASNTGGRSCNPPPAPKPPSPPPPPPPSAPSANYNHTPNDGPLMAVTKLTATGAEIAVFGYKTVNNLPADHVKSVTVTDNGVQRASRTDFSGSPAHRANLTFADTNLTDGKLHNLVFKAVNENGASNSVSITITAGNTAPKPPPPPPAGGTNPPPPPGPSANNGTIKVGVYAHDKVGQALDKSKDNRVGSVYISTESIGSIKQCSGIKHTLTDGKTTSTTAGLTNADRGSGSNFGLINFSECPVADQAGSDNYAKKYRVSMNISSGFTLDDGYNKGVDAKVNGNIVYRDVTVRKNQQTEVSFLLIGSNGSVENPNNPSPGPVPNPPGSGGGTPTTKPQLCDTDKSAAGVSTPTNGKGSIAVCTYDITGGNKALIGDIEVHTKSIGAADTTQFQCDPRNRTTGADGSNGIKGRATFPNCPVAQDGTAKTYQVSLVKRTGYREAASSPHLAGCDNSKYHFKVEKNKVKRIEVYLVKAESTAAKASCDSVPLPGGSDPENPPILPPSPNRSGKVTVETWVDVNNKESFKDQPLKNIPIEMVSPSRPEDNCTPARGNTKSSSADSPAKLDLNNCPVAFNKNNNDYAKTWDIYATIPSGYTMSSRFSAGPGVNTTVLTQGGVKKIKRTVTLTKDDIASFSIIFINNASGGGCPTLPPGTGGISPTSGDCTTPTPTPVSGAAFLPVVCDDIKTTISPLTRTETKKYADYVCTAGARLGVDPALILAVISVESMGNTLVKDPITFKAKDGGGAKGPGQMLEATWNSNKFGGRLLYPGDGGTDTKGVDTFKSTWSNQKWSDAVFSVANYLDKVSDPSERLSEEQVRKAACGYNSGNKSACQKNSSYNGTGAYGNKVVAAWKKYKNPGSNGDAGNIPATPGTAPAPAPSTPAPARMVGGVVWSWPVGTGYPVTHCYKEDRGYLHSGIDIGSAGKSAPAIRAAADGVIILRRVNATPLEGYGNALYIEHSIPGNPDRKYYTLYGHLASFEPGIGETVKVARGQVLGRMGQTGKSDGIHLHFNVQSTRVPSGDANSSDKGSSNGTLNPLNYMPDDGRSVGICKAGSAGF